jgi:hypothetical protein
MAAAARDEVEALKARLDAMQPADIAPPGNGKRGG